MIFNDSPLGTASLFMQGFGLLTSATGSYYSAKMQKNNLQFAASTDDLNAHMAEMGAQQELLKGQQQVGALTLRAGQLKGTQRASMAANGIDLGTGSAAEVQASTDLMKETDMDTITANAVRTAFGYRTQATNYQNDALMKRAGAAGINPGAAAFATLLGGAGRVAQSWYQLNKNTKNSNTSDDPLYDMGQQKGWW